MNYARFLIVAAACSMVLATAVFGQIGERLLINGYSSFEFEKQLDEQGEGDPNGSFDADLFDLVLNVYATTRLRIAADFSWEHGPASEDNRGNVVLEYGFGEFIVSEALRIRAGKMFTSFSIYNEIHTAKPAFLTVKEPLSTNKNEKFGSQFRFYPRWGTGIAILGNGQLGTLDSDYIIQVTNGEQDYSDNGANPFEEDDNLAKSFLGRARIYPTPSAELGVSAYYDRFNATDSTGALDGSENDLFSLGSHLQVTGDAVGLELEYVFGLISGNSGTLNRAGLTAMVYTPIRDYFVPYLRFEYLDPNFDVEDDFATLIIPGLNIQVDDGLYVKLEANFLNSGANNVQFNGIGYTELKAAIAIGF